jgi:hypothetical protein
MFICVKATHGGRHDTASFLTGITTVSQTETLTSQSTVSLVMTQVCSIKCIDVRRSSALNKTLHSSVPNYFRRRSLRMKRRSWKPFMRVLYWYRIHLKQDFRLLLFYLIRHLRLIKHFTRNQGLATELLLKMLLHWLSFIQTSNVGKLAPFDVL